MTLLPPLPPPLPITGVTESIRGRRWADVADKVEAEEAALAEVEAHLTPPGRVILADFVAAAKPVRHRRKGHKGGRSSTSPATVSAPARARSPGSSGRCSKEVCRTTTSFP